MIFSIKPQIFELKCVFSYFRLKTHITLLLPVYVHSWEQRKLGDFGKATGGTSIESEFSEDGIYKVISIGSYSENSVYNDQGIRAIKSDKTSNRVLNRNDLTMILNDKTTSGNIIGRVLLIEESGIYVYNQRTERIEINLDEYDSVFLYEMLNAPNIREKIIKQAQGNTQIYVNWTAISLLKYMIPSKEEQVKIGEYLHSISNLITLHQCKCQIDGCRFQSPLAITWEQRKVQDVADRFDNLRIPVAANLRVHGTTPYYGANGIQDYVEGFTHDGEFVLVAEDGANDLKNYPVKCVNGRIWVNNHAHVLQGKAGISDNSFLAFAISQSDIESLLVGGSRAKLNAETLMSIEFKLPCLQEQYRIGEYLTQLDHLITLHQRKPVVVNSSSTMNALPNQHLYFQVLE